MTDLNSVFANLERTFALNARMARDRAEYTTAAMNRPGAQNIKESFLGEIAQAEAEAARWEARRREAANGYMLAGPADLNDPVYMSNYGDILSEAQAAGRAVHRETPEGDAIQRESGAQGGGSSGRDGGASYPLK